jgi:hypothetical protein
MTLKISPIEAIKINPACLPKSVPHNSLVIRPMLTKVKLIHIKFDNLIASCGASIDEKILTKVAPIKGYKGWIIN